MDKKTRPRWRVNCILLRGNLCYRIYYYFSHLDAVPENLALYLNSFCEPVSAPVLSMSNEGPQTDDEDQEPQTDKASDNDSDEG